MFAFARRSWYQNWLVMAKGLQTGLIYENAVEEYLITLVCDGNIKLFTLNKCSAFNI